MRGKTLFLILLTLFVLKSSLSSASGDPGIQFIENKGQWDPQILYRAELNSGYLFITPKGLQYVFFQQQSLKGFKDSGTRTENPNVRTQPSNPDKGNDDNNKLNVHSFSLDFTGDLENMQIEPGTRKFPYYNFFTGKDPSRWADHVNAFGEITFKNICPGIHFRLYSTSGYMKYDIIVEPGADLQSFRYRYNGVDSIRQNFNSLYITTSIGRLIENSPFAYQLSGRDTVNIDCRFRMEGDDISFELPKGYNPAKQLIIDPLLVFSTYSGSTMDNWGNTATYDKHGNVYSGGTVWDALGGDLPVTNGAYQTTFGGVWDVAILKFDSTGKSLLYATYLGGSDTETPLSLIVNNSNELVIFGITGSSDFPVKPDAWSTLYSGGERVTNALGDYNTGRFLGIHYLNGSDFFISKLNQDGSQLLSSTYLGGTMKDGINNAPGYPLSRNYGDEFRGEVNIDKLDNIYIISNTSSPDFPIVNGFKKTFGGGTHDGVVAKLSPDLSSLIWSTFLGGSNMDSGYGIKVLDNKQVVVTGGTMSDDFPVTNGSYQVNFGGDVDGFICKISQNGDSLLASTYVGTVDYDQTYFIDLDAEKDIYVFGQTNGIYPVSDSVYKNPNSGQFIQKFSNDLKTSIFSTVIGSGRGSPDISPTAFLVNECENIFLSGWGGNINTPDFFGIPVDKYVGGSTLRLPVTKDAFQSITDGSEFYLMVLSKDARQLLYSTFLGALNSGPGEHVDGGTSRFDKRGIVYHAICACRDDSQFPTTPGVWSNTNNSRNCNNGVFKFDLASLKAAFTTNTPEFDHPGITSECYPFNIVFLNRSVGGKLFQWDFGDNTSPLVQDDSVYHLYTNPGSYLVQLYALDENTCQKIDIAKGNIEVFEPFFIFPPDTTICSGDQVALEAGGAAFYRWTPSYGLNDSTLASPIVSPDSTTIYRLSMIDNNSCTQEDTVVVSVVPSVGIDFQWRLIYDCISPAKVELENFTTHADRFTWNFGDGNFSDEQSITYQYKDTGNFVITLHAYGGNVCEDSAIIKVHITDLFAPNVITPNNDAHNEFFEVLTDAPVKLRIFNRWGGLVYKSESYRNDWGGGDLNAGVYYYELTLNNEATCNGWIQLLK